jgi:hypothetical protein
MLSTSASAFRRTILILSAPLFTICAPRAARAQESSAGDTALARQVKSARVRLERALSVASARGTPISAKYEIEEGKLQLSVYTATKSGHFWEVVVDHRTGRIAKAEEIKAGDDLAAAKSQDEAIGKAKRSLRAAVERALRDNKGYRGASATATLKDGKAAAEITLVKGSVFKTVSEPLT